MLLTHQQVFCANQTTKATLCGKHEVQRGVFFLFLCRENPELLVLSAAPLALPSYARALLTAVFSVNTHNDVLVGRVVEAGQLGH
jgi:hypothetical protein